MAVIQLDATQITPASIAGIATAAAKKAVGAAASGPHGQRSSQQSQMQQREQQRIAEGGAAFADLLGTDGGGVISDGDDLGDEWGEGVADNAENNRVVDATASPTSNPWDEIFGIPTDFVQPTSQTAQESKVAETPSLVEDAQRPEHDIGQTAEQAEEQTAMQPAVAISEPATQSPSEPSDDLASTDSRGEPVVAEGVAATTDMPIVGTTTADGDAQQATPSTDWLHRLTEARSLVRELDLERARVKMGIDDLKQELKRIEDQREDANSELGSIIDEYSNGSVNGNASNGSGDNCLPYGASHDQQQSNTGGELPNGVISNDSPICGPNVDNVSNVVGVVVANGCGGTAGVSASISTRPVEVTASATGRVADINAWRLLPVTELAKHGLSRHICKTLSEGGYATLGSLQTTSDFPGCLKLQGVKRGTLDKIARAFEGFWAKHPEYCDGREPLDSGADASTASSSTTPSEPPADASAFDAADVSAEADDVGDQEAVRLTRSATWPPSVRLTEQYSYGDDGHKETLKPGEYQVFQWESTEGDAKAAQPTVDVGDGCVVTLDGNAKWEAIWPAEEVANGGNDTRGDVMGE